MGLTIIMGCGCGCGCGYWVGVVLLGLLLFQCVDLGVDVGGTSWAVLVWVHQVRLGVWIWAQAGLLLLRFCSMGTIFFELLAGGADVSVAVIARGPTIPCLCPCPRPRPYPCRPFVLFQASLRFRASAAYYCSRT